MRPRSCAPAARFLPLVLCALLPGGCAAPGIPHDSGGGTASEATATLPPWVGQPLTWEKLSAIESWLESGSASSSPYWGVEGELALSEGRLSFAQSDALSAGADPGALAARLGAARQGFERVLADSRASGDQIERARVGLEASQGPAVEPERPSQPHAREASWLSGVIPRASWGASRAIPSKMVRNQNGWRYITVHHSAERHPPELSGSLEDSASAVRSIQHAHMNGEGYGDLGYHYVIDPYGRVFQGRELTWQGAHAGGSNNLQNIGICLLGNFDVEHPTPAALGALQHLLDELRAKWNIPRKAVRAHCDWKTTDCPGTYLQSWVRSYS
jgi:hypothetical protein